jgi:hypothetical protein
MIEIAAKDVVFHFNKKHLEDSTIPMWVLKTQGESYYVNHVDCEIPWSTKETPDNPSTKGSIKVKDVLLKIDDNNCAQLLKLTHSDKIRLRNQKLGINRIIVKEGQDHWRFKESIKNLNIKHGPIKAIGGACTSTFYITDILDKSQFSMLALAMSNNKSFRILMPNEGYYKYYDDPRYKDNDFINEDSAYWSDDDEDY